MNNRFVGTGMIDATCFGDSEHKFINVGTGAATWWDQDLSVNDQNFGSGISNKCDYCGCSLEKLYGYCEHCGAPL